MLGQDSFSVQRRPLDVEDYIDIARRHKGWIFGPMFFALVGTVVGAFLWPDTYESTATIKVNPQQIPTAFVQANVNQQLQDRISSLAQSILSRNTLQVLVQTHGLYKKELEKRPIDDVVEDMRQDIQIGQVAPLGGPTPAGGKAAPPPKGATLSAFQISFDYTDRYKAQRVVKDLSERFITQNFVDRSRDSQMTNSLLQDAWNAANTELQKAEKNLAEFRARNQGSLPDEMQSNLQQLGTLQTRISTLNEQISRNNQERLYMEGMLRNYKSELDEMKKPQTQRTVSQKQKSDKLADVDKEIRTLETTLAGLKDRYKDTHPDVQRVTAALANAKQRREAVAKEEGDGGSEQVTETAVVTDAQLKEIRDLEAKYRDTESRIASLNAKSQDTQHEMDRLSSISKNFEAKLQGTPFSARDYTELLRVRDGAKATVDDLSKKLNTSNLAETMEKNKQGESLEYLDQPSLPMTPIKPKRALIIGIGAALGLIIGFGLAGLREVKDTSLKNLKDVRAYTQMQVLGSIPLLENDLVIKRRRRIAWLGWALACLAGVAVMSGSIIYYYASKA